MNRAQQILKSFFEEEGDLQFAKRRDKSVGGKADWGKSKESERSSNQNKLVNKWANKRRHHSPDGKRMHRKIGRLLSKSIDKNSSTLTDAIKDTE